MATYMRLRNGSWGVRVQGQARPGQVVTVTKKSGESKRECVSRVLWTGDGVSICAIESGDRDSYGYSIRSGASYRAGVTAPYGRRCPICGSRECEKAWDPRALCDED